MNIAICDDVLAERLYLRDLIDSYNTDIPITLKLFCSGAELFSGMKHFRFDLIFLDIMMPQQNGLEIAAEIRALGNDVKIIFLSNSPSFAVDGYEYGAYRYLLKPVKEDILYRTLEKVLETHDEKYVPLKTKSGLVKLSVDNVMYVEVYANSVCFHLRDEDKIEVRGTLIEFEPYLLGDGTFFKIHRAYIVNLNHVKEKDKNDVVLNDGRRLPIARQNIKAFKDAYTLNLFSSYGG